MGTVLIQAFHLGDQLAFSTGGDECLDVITYDTERRNIILCVSYQDTNLECKNMKEENSTSVTFNALPVPPHQNFKVCGYEINKPDEAACSMGVYDPDGLFEIVNMSAAIPTKEAPVSGEGPEEDN